MLYLLTPNTEVSNFTFVGARPTSGVFDLSANGELDVDLFYGAFTKPLKFKSGAGEYRVFGLHYHDGRPVVKTDNRPSDVRQADGQNIRITSIGGHYIGFHSGSGKFDVLVWGVGQFGSWGQLDQRSVAIAIEGGFQPGKSATKYNPGFESVTSAQQATTIRMTAATLHSFRCCQRLVSTLAFRSTT